jgi:hypothetical protein
MRKTDAEGAAYGSSVVERPQRLFCPNGSDRERRIGNRQQTVG